MFRLPRRRDHDRKQPAPPIEQPTLNYRNPAEDKVDEEPRSAVKRLLDFAVSFVLEAVVTVAALFVYFYIAGC